MISKYYFWAYDCVGLKRMACVKKIYNDQNYRGMSILQWATVPGVKGVPMTRGGV